VRRVASALLAVAALGPFTAGPVTANAAEVTLAENTLTIRDVIGEPNMLELTPTGFATYEIFDAASPLQAGAGCANLSPELVRCFGFALNVQVNGGPGDDLIGAWNDLGVPVALDGGAGDDGLAGGPRNDALDGGVGDDSLSGGPGDDRGEAAEGSDYAEGGPGADTLLGAAGDDIIVGGPGGGDVLLGESDRDLLVGGRGADQLQGRDDVGTGTGDDDVFAQGQNAAADQVDCRPGDHVTGRVRVVDAGCDVSPETRPLPQAWPPPEDLEPTASQATNLQFFGHLFRPGAAHRYWAWVGSPPETKYVVDVVVQLHSGGRRLYKRCLHRIWTNAKNPRQIPARASRATKITGQVLKGRSCP
jgi:hypothetical protein